MSLVLATVEQPLGPWIREPAFLLTALLLSAKSASEGEATASGCSHIALSRRCVGSQSDTVATCRELSGILNAGERPRPS